MINIKIEKPLKVQRRHRLPSFKAAVPVHSASFTHNLSLRCKIFILASPRVQWYCKLVIKKGPGLISFAVIDPLIWETESPMTHGPKNVNESLWL